MNKPYLFIALLAAYFSNVLAFSISKDTTNFTIDSQYVYLINNSPAQISIDTLIITILNGAYVASYFRFYLDTVKPVQSVDEPYFYSNPNPFPTHTFTKGACDTTTAAMPSSNIRIASNDSLRIRDARFSGGLASVLMKAFKDLEMVDTIKVNFICSNSQRDSLIAIVGEYETSSIKPGRYSEQNTKGNLPANYYLLNGKVIHSADKLNRVIKISPLTK